MKTASPFTPIKKFRVLVQQGANWVPVREALRTISVDNIETGPSRSAVMRHVRTFIRPAINIKLEEIQ